MARQKQTQHQLKKGKTESLLFGTAKRLSTKDPMQVYVNGKLINAADGYKYLGVWMDSTLNVNVHLRRMLRKVNAKIKLFSRVRRSLTIFAAKAIYTSFILPTMVYRSTPVVRVSDTMSKKFDSVQRRAEKVIYGLRETNRSELISINNHRNIKVVIQMLKCWQGASILAIRAYADTIDHQHETRSNRSLLRLPLVKTETARRSLYFQATYCFNELPRDMRSITSIAFFKSKAKEHFLS